MIRINGCTSGYIVREPATGKTYLVPNHLVDSFLRANDLRILTGWASECAKLGFWLKVRRYFKTGRWPR